MCIRDRFVPGMSSDAEYGVGLNWLNGLNGLNGLNVLTGLNGLNVLITPNGLNGLSGLNGWMDDLTRSSRRVYTFFFLAKVFWRVGFLNRWNTQHLTNVAFFVFVFSNHFFSSSQLFSSPLCPLSLLVVVTQIRGHIAGSSPPLPTTVRALHFYRENISALSSLVDSRRIVLTDARRSQQLILFFIFATKFEVWPRRDSN